ncbi:hypothetical protein GOP47_0027339 [Adiantum capillus-veneris]|nr:hypothetical protein GOP47_0027339 [Adiantum capillus-veneris]
MAKALWLFTKRSTMAAMIAVTLADRVGNVARTQGDSMQPTLQPGDKHLLGFLKGDVVFFEKFSASGYKYCRGDVVVLRSPSDPNQWMVKRLIALQGDWINVPGSYEILQIPKGRCWVEGDNGNLSLDSRTFGAIPLALVKGRVTHKIWPPNRVGRVERVLPGGRVMLDDLV